MLSDEEALTPAEECYHRLLAGDLNEAGELVDSYVKTNSLTALYDSVLIPVVTSAEMDHRREALDNEQRAAVEQGVRDIVEDLGTRPAPASKIDADVAVAAHTARAGTRLAGLLPSGARGSRRACRQDARARASRARFSSGKCAG